MSQYLDWAAGWAPYSVNDGDVVLGVTREGRLVFDVGGFASAPDGTDSLEVVGIAVSSDGFQAVVSTETDLRLYLVEPAEQRLTLHWSLPHPKGVPARPLATATVEFGHEVLLNLDGRLECLFRGRHGLVDRTTFDVADATGAARTRDGYLVVVPGRVVRLVRGQVRPQRALERVTHLETFPDGTIAAVARDGANRATSLLTGAAESPDSVELRQQFRGISPVRADVSKRVLCVAPGGLVDPHVGALATATASRSAIDVFISYRSSQRELAKELRRLLSAQPGLAVWLDVNEIAAQPQKEIKDALDDARFYAVLWGPDSGDKRDQEVHTSKGMQRKLSQFSEVDAIFRQLLRSRGEKAGVMLLLNGVHGEDLAWLEPELPEISEGGEVYDVGEDIQYSWQTPPGRGGEPMTIERFAESIVKGLAIQHSNRIESRR